MYMTVRVRSVEQMFTVVISKGRSLWESWADVRGGRDKCPGIVGSLDVGPLDCHCKPVGRSTLSSLTASYVVVEGDCNAASSHPSSSSAATATYTSTTYITSRRFVLALARCCRRQWRN